MTPVAEVHGRVAPGFEEVAEVLGRSALGDGGGAFAAVVAGEVVVDLWTGSAGDGPWQQDTVSCAYSASKGVVTALLVLLHHDGVLDLDAPVADVWPEFAAAGKAGVTVRQLLSHSAGLPEIPGYQGFLDVHGRNWGEHEQIWQRLAAATPLWEPGTAHGYHGLTFGYLAGALVQRLTGTSLAAGVRERLAEVRGPEVHLGLAAATVGVRARQLPPAPLTPEQQAAAEPVLALARDPGSLLGKAFLAQDGTTVLEHLVAAGTEPACLDVGAGNGDVLCTARGLAGCYDTLARGPWRPSVLAFGTVQRSGPDLVLGVPARWCVGFQGNEVSLSGALTMGPGRRAFGHAGAGGQLGGHDPDRELSFGFVRNQLSSVGTVATDLVHAVAAALG